MKIIGMENNDTVLKEIGSRIKRLRVTSSMKQSELAAQAGVSVVTVARIEGGAPSNTENLIRIMRALGVLQNIDLMIPEQDVLPREINDYGRVRKRVTDNKKKTEAKKIVWGDGR